MHISFGLYEYNFPYHIPENVHKCISGFYNVIKRRESFANCTDKIRAFTHSLNFHFFIQIISDKFNSRLKQLLGLTRIQN